ncbi:MAG TPA: enolase C-terminal domain-like protein [Solirubrobacteraceae bacterium]|nr:enolase C-terminal domain-like protein [Solirubrobacteraceae bacterium]
MTATSAVTGIRVTAVEAIPVALPLRRPLGFASGRIDTADNVLVRIHSDAGLVGCAEAQARPYTYGETRESIMAAVREWFAPRLQGADPLAPERARMACAGLPGNLCARAAVEVALADLAGQLLGLSCAMLLGGAAESVAVASMLSFGDPAEMAAEASFLHGAYGIARFKAKVGRDPDLDVAAVTAVREAVPDAELYVDANRGWTLEQARRAAPALIELGVTAIEEPLDLADEAGRRELAAEWSVPLGGDESCLTLADVAREIAGPVGQVSIKVARTAFRQSRDVLAHCEATGVPAVVGSQYEGALGAWASIAFGAGTAALCDQPAEAGNFLDLAGDLVAPPVIVDGRVDVPCAPGLGVGIDDDALAHYRVDR